MRCAVLGASGYAGAELIALLAAHPAVDELRAQADRHAGERWERLHGWGRHAFRSELEPIDPDAVQGFDVVFSALPHGVSSSVAARLHGRVGLVVDLSGDLRTPDAAAYERAYGAPHPAPQLLRHAVYSLPELFGDRLPGATLVACAGCYATVAQLAAAPALGAAIDCGPRVVVSAVSGTTGAGRTTEPAFAFSEADGDLRAYRVGRHAHAPEIARGLSQSSGRSVVVTFIPHVAPIRRGILATIVLTPERPLDASEVRLEYARAYVDSPFVRVLEDGELPRVADVARTPFCDLGVAYDALSGDVVVVGAIDNLLKGAAAQAVQSMNLVLGLPETSGLLAESRFAEVAHV